MGGGDVTDMQQLHCTPTIMGHNRWWLKLFFYMLDVGTSNVLLIYNEAMKENQSPLNIVEFKTRLIELLGAKVGKLGTKKNDGVEHALVKIPGKYHQRCSIIVLSQTDIVTPSSCVKDVVNHIVAWGVVKPQEIVL